MSYRVGDKVRILDHLLRGNAPNPNGYGYCSEMNELKGRPLTIKRLIRNGIGEITGVSLEECPNRYSYDLLWIQPDVDMTFEGIKKARTNKDITDEQYLQYMTQVV